MLYSEMIHSLLKSGFWFIESLLVYWMNPAYLGVGFKASSLDMMRTRDRKGMGRGVKATRAKKQLVHSSMHDACRVTITWKC